MKLTVFIFFLREYSIGTWWRNTAVPKPVLATCTSGPGRVSAIFLSEFATCKPEVQTLELLCSLVYNKSNIITKCKLIFQLVFLSV